MVEVWRSLISVMGGGGEMGTFVELRRRFEGDVCVTPAKRQIR